MSRFLKLNEEGVQRLKEMYHNHYDYEMAEEFGVNRQTIGRWAKILGLSKDAEFVTSRLERAGRAAARKLRRCGFPHLQHPNVIATQFKKGQPRAYSPESIAKGVETFRGIVVAERRRLLFGLPQKTKLNVSAQPKKKQYYRKRLRSLGYKQSEDDRNTFYILPTTKRSLKNERDSAAQFKIRFIDATETCSIETCETCETCETR